MNTLTLTIPNISCKHCIHTIKMELMELSGVEKVDADLNTKQVTVQFNDNTSKEAIVDLLNEINYPPESI